MSSYPLRTIIRCVHDGQKLGSVVVIRGDPIYDENQTIVGYKNRFMQIRLGSVKGAECRAFFETLDEWHQSMGIVYPMLTTNNSDMLCTNIVVATFIVSSIMIATYVQSFLN
jgi:hypothetical protein